MFQRCHNSRKCEICTCFVYFGMMSLIIDGDSSEREIEELRGLRVVQAVISSGRFTAVYVITEGGWNLQIDASYSKIE